MIQKISFQNYKAFKNGEIELKPITILLGANSVGKSSIINLLLMLQQTANATNYKFALKLNGENVGMGECKNIFRNHETSKNLILEFEFSDEKLLDMLNEKLMSDLRDRTSKPLRFLFFLSEKKQERYKTKYFDNKNQIKKNVFADETLFRKFLTEMYELRKEIFPTQDISDDSEDYTKTYSFLKSLSEVNRDNFILSFEIKHIEKKEKQTKQEKQKKQKSELLKINKIILKQASRIVLSIELNFKKDNSGYQAIDVISEFADCTSISKEHKNELLQAINFDSTIFSVLSSIEDNYEGNNPIFSRTIFEIFSQAMENVENQFKTNKSINHISPLRAHPQRYYGLDKANINTYLNSLDGNSLVEILKENKEVRDLVNGWLKTILKMGVNVNPINDVIHSLKIKPPKLIFDLDITDVGFGISQMLPVIVQSFMSEKDSITMIEQPEIHLHPKLQADLADLFIHIVKTHNQNAEKCLLIETHSEYLLRRLRRKISEKEISNEEVAVYFIAPPKNKNSSAIIDKKKVSENGYFDYPQDFMGEDLEKDMISFINQQFNK